MWCLKRAQGHRGKPDPPKVKSGQMLYCNPFTYILKIQVMIASPGSYMWVEEVVAYHLYEQSIGNTSEVTQTWSRHIRKSKGGM